MMNIHEELIQIFEDTLDWINKNPELKTYTEYSVQNTKLYYAEEFPVLPDFQPSFDTKIEVLPQKSFETAIQLRKQYPDAKIAVHNFASATNPGGGVTNGSRAQEESLCRCSNLYPCLNQGWLKRDYYLFHRIRNDLCYTDACIYSPDILIIKTDDHNLPERMPQTDWCKVDVLTCAAPNLRLMPYNRMNPGKNSSALQLTDQELEEIHYNRAKHMLSIALANHIEVLVLGAFGCGAFQNNPYVIAKVYHKILQEPEFRNKFQHVAFAIYYTQREKNNYLAFQKYFQQ